MESPAEQHWNESIRGTTKVVRNKKKCRKLGLSSTSMKSRGIILATN